jgi:pyrroloquinoline quinone biosynthesis protein D
VLIGIGPDSVPSLAARALLRHDAVRGVDLVLLPERIITLNRTARAVVDRCDGRRTVREIAGELERAYDRAGLEPSVVRLLQRLGEQGAIAW